MPIPTPKPKEDQKTFVSRCISAVHDADPNRPQKQIIAICYSTWRRSKRKKGKRAVQETQEIVKWYEARVKMTRTQAKKLGKKIANKAEKEAPSWVQTARKLLASKKGNPKLRAYWKKRLMAYEADKK